jgi:hypothetical protein
VCVFVFVCVFVLFCLCLLTRTYILARWLARKRALSHVADVDARTYRSGSVVPVVALLPLRWHRASHRHSCCCSRSPAPSAPLSQMLSLPATPTCRPPARRTSASAIPPQHPPYVPLRCSSAPTASCLRPRACRPTHSRTCSMSATWTL